MQSASASPQTGPELVRSLPDASRPSLIGLFGTPSAMMHWGIHLARVVVGVLGGNHRVVHGNYLAEFADLPSDDADPSDQAPAALNTPGRAPSDQAVPEPAPLAATVVICTSDCPEIALCHRLLRGDVPVVVFAEDPADVIDDIVAVSGTDPVNALRLAARSLCALQPLIGASGISVFGRAQLDGDLAGFLNGLLAGLRIAPSPEQRREIDRQLSGAVEPSREHLGRLFPVFVARRRELVREAASDPTPEAAVRQDPSATAEGADALPAPADSTAGTLPAIATSGIKAVALSYAKLASGLPFDEAEWPASIFSSGDAIGEFLAGPCEMIGPARIVAYGPYMHLPLGDWSSRVEIEVADNASGNQLKVDLVCGPDVLVSASADMPAHGYYAFVLAFSITEPLNPVELRFQIESGAIEGRLLLRRVLMTRRPAGLRLIA